MSSDDDQKRIGTYLEPILAVLAAQPDLGTLNEKIVSLRREVGVQSTTAGTPQTTVEKVEVEDKYEVDDADGLLERLRMDGFRLRVAYLQVDVYLDAGKTLHGVQQALRLRMQYNAQGLFAGGELKWEGPRGALQDRPVVEVPVPSEEDCAVIRTLLREQLDITPHSTFQKDRELFEKRSGAETVLIELDAFNDPGNPAKIQGRTFAQVAMEVDEERRREALERVKAVAKMLELHKRHNRDYSEIAR